jgi:hypothetical protein
MPAEVAMASESSVLRTSTPLCVAVTGHRTLSAEHAPAVTERVNQALTDIQSLVPHTTIRIVSGLAEGADRVVAQAGLDLGMEVEVVVAAPLGQYRSRFTAASRDDFDAFLRLPGVALTEVSEDDDTAGGSVGKEAAPYVAVGRYLASRANLLFALWDGSLTGLAGGTADVLLGFLGAGEGISPEPKLRFLDDEGAEAFGPEFALWFPVPRDERASEDLAHAGPVYLSGAGSRALSRHESMPGALRQQLEELERYNLSGTSESGPQSGTPETDALVADSPVAMETDLELLAIIEREFAKADRLAITNQRRSDRLFLAFGVMAALTGALFLTYAALHHVWAYLIGYLVLLLGGIFLLRLSRRMRWFRQHLLYRTLAEVLRTRLYLAGAGIGDSPLYSDLLELSGVTRYPGYGLVSLVSKSVEPNFPGGGSGSWKPDDPRFTAVERRWVDGQIGYFESRITRLLRTLRRFGWVKTGLVVVTVLGLLGLIIFGNDLATVDLGGGVIAKGVVIFFVALLPYLVGVWGLYESKLATPELLWLYRDQADSFRRARTALRSSATTGEKRDILVELGRGSTMENLLWVVHRYHREHQPPS